jgi:hypothetical protein
MNIIERIKTEKIAIKCKDSEINSLHRIIFGENFGVNCGTAWFCSLLEKFLPTLPFGYSEITFKEFMKEYEKEQIVTDCHKLEKCKK